MRLQTCARTLRNPGQRRWSRGSAHCRNSTHSESCIERHPQPGRAGLDSVGTWRIEALVQLAQYLIAHEAIGAAGAQCRVLDGEEGRLPAAVEGAFHAHFPAVRARLDLE